MKVFPLEGWKNLPRMPHPRKPGKICPEISFWAGSFSERRGERIHGGSDIVAPEGTRFISPEGGTVWMNLAHGDKPDRHVYWTSGGWHCYVRGNDGILYYGAHLREAPIVRPGQRVRAGDLLGFVGVSGNTGSWKDQGQYEKRQGRATTCPHLHLQMFKLTADGKKGKAVDPYPYLLRTRPLAAAEVRTIGKIVGGLAIVVGAFFLYKLIKKR